MQRLIIDGVELELDDGVDPSSLDQGDEPRADGEVDLAALETQAQADVLLEDDAAAPYVSDEDPA